MYTQVTHSFNEQWALTLGIRWAQDEKEAFENRTGYFETEINDPFNFINLDPEFGSVFDADAVFDGICVGRFGAPSCAALVPTCALDDPDCASPLRLQGLPFSFADTIGGDDAWSDVTYRVNLDWTPNADTLVYASVTTGYRAGGYWLGIGDSRGASEAGTVVPATYDEESIVAYEVAYKGTFLDGRLQIDSSVYHYDFDSYHDRTEFFNAVSGTAVDVVQNVDKAQNRGVEIELTWLPTDAWTIGGNGSWTDSEYKSDFFVLEDDNPDFPLPLFDDVTGGDAFIVRNLKGNALECIPEWKFTTWTSNDWVFDAGVLTAGATWSYTGSYYSEGSERRLDEVPSRDRVDLYLTRRDSRDHWNVRAFVDNVFDDVNLRGIGTGTAASDWQRTASSLNPRFCGLDVTYRMGPR